MLRVCLGGERNYVLTRSRVPRKWQQRCILQLAHTLQLFVSSENLQFLVSTNQHVFCSKCPLAHLMIAFTQIMSTRRRCVWLACRALSSRGFRAISVVARRRTTTGRRLFSFPGQLAQTDTKNTAPQRCDNRCMSRIYFKQTCLSALATASCLASTMVSLDASDLAASYIISRYLN